MIPRSERPRYTAEAFADLCERPRKIRDGQWMALCPAHNDKRPSLSIKDGDRGVVIRCFAGCDFLAILSELDVRPEQLFRDTGESWRSSPRVPKPDPSARARELAVRCANYRQAPHSDQLNRELVLVGALLLEGSKGFKDLPQGFRREGITFGMLRLVFDAIADLAGQGTPRRWFSPFALGRLIDSVAGEPGRARKMGVWFWCRVGIHLARYDRSEEQ